MRLADLTWPQVHGLTQRGAVLVVPVGSTEQHGPHLPLSTDTDVAVALAAGLARRRDDVLLAPEVPYGASGEHAGFPGTVSIGQDAVEMLLVELGRSASETFSRTLLVSGHGGNAGPVNRAVRRLRAEGRDLMAWAPCWRGDAHAGRTETSVQLALDATRVDLPHAEPGVGEPLAELMPRLRAGGVRAVSGNGVLGDPTGASADEGRALLEEAVDDLERAVARWLRLPVPADATPSEAAS